MLTDGSSTPSPLSLLRPTERDAKEVHLFTNGPGTAFTDVVDVTDEICERGNAHAPLAK